MNLQFIIRSGNGYFIKFVNTLTPLMTTDPVEATRLRYNLANSTLNHLNELGFDCEPVLLQFARMK